MRNMKTMIRVSVIAFAMIFTAGFLGVYGTMSIPAADKAYAANDGYTYTVTVYSGKEGYFNLPERRGDALLAKRVIQRSFQVRRYSF